MMERRTPVTFPSKAGASDSAPPTREAVRAAFLAGDRTAPLALGDPPLVYPPGVPGLTSVLIPVRGAHAELRFALRCLQAHTCRPAEIVIACARAEAPAVEAIFEEECGGGPFKGALAVSAEPQGFPANVNLARFAARGTTLVILNSDAYVPMRWDSIMHETLTDGVVAAGPVAQMRVATLNKLDSRGPGLVSRACRDAHEQLLARFDPLTDAQRLIGFCLMLRAKDFDRVGGLHEGYGLGNWDDDDLSFKLRFLGDLKFAPLVVAHAVSASFRALPDAEATYNRLLVENKAIFEQRWGWAADLLPPVKFSNLFVEAS